MGALGCHHQGWIGGFLLVDPARIQGFDASRREIGFRRRDGFRGVPFKEPCIGAIGIGLIHPILAIAVAVEGGRVVHEDNRLSRVTWVGSINGIANGLVEIARQSVQGAPEFLGEIRWILALPIAPGHTVALGGIHVPEVRIPRHVQPELRCLSVSQDSGNDAVEIGMKLVTINFPLSDLDLLFTGGCDVKLKYTIVDDVKKTYVIASDA